MKSLIITSMQKIERKGFIMGKNILEIQNLTKYYGKIKGVENLSLKLEEGEIFGFIGPNGARKINNNSFYNELNK